MYRPLLPALILLLIIPCGHLMAQGCSDAGFCTMGAMKPDQPFNKKISLKLRSMEISFYRGTTTLTPVVYVATADLNFSLNAKTSFQVKLPYQAVRSGALAQTQGMGDISLCLTRQIYTSEKFDINLSVGGKLPSNGADKTVDGLPLPMYYQTSLGTYDFITGVSLISRKWLLATGIQHPFNQTQNNFRWEAWPADAQSYIIEYPQAKRLRRGTDVMLRVERNFRFSRLNFSVGILPIYRVTQDKIEDAAGNLFKVPGAKGLAMSGIATVGYSLSVRHGVKLLVGHKIVQRDRNPDGLTRELVSTVSYYYRF